MKAQKPYSVTRIGGCAGGVAMSRLGEGSGSGAQGAGGSLRVQTGMQVVRSSGFGQGGTCRGSALGVGLPDSRISLSPYARPPARPPACSRWLLLAAGAACLDWEPWVVPVPGWDCCWVPPPALDSCASFTASDGNGPSAMAAARACPTPWTIRRLQRPDARVGARLLRPQSLQTDGPGV